MTKPRRIAPQEAEQLRDYRAKLVSCHGAQRAAAILAGEDAAFNADLAAWNALGKPKGAAA